MAANFSELLKAWEGQKVTVVNPESYSLGMLGEKLDFESYDVKLVNVTSDFIQISFTRPKKGEETLVEQYIPLHKIKRVSVWGAEKYIQI